MGGGGVKKGRKLVDVLCTRSLSDLDLDWTDLDSHNPPTCDGCQSHEFCKCFQFARNDWTIKYNQEEPVQPKYDVNAPDLYIPSMAYMTYILIVGYILGLRDAFSPDLLATTARYGQCNLNLNSSPNFIFIFCIPNIKEEISTARQSLFADRLL